MTLIYKNGWLRFSLKTLLLVMTALAIVLGFYVKSFRDRRAAIAAVEDLDGWISYKQGGPNWLRRFVRDEKYFWSPVAVRFNPKHSITDAELQSVLTHLKKFDEMTYLNFYQSQLTDAGLAQLLPLANQLEALDIRDTRVSDESIADLQRLSRLAMLRLKGSAVSVEGIEKIRQALPNCKLE